MTINDTNTSTIHIPGTHVHYLEPAPTENRADGRLRYLQGGHGSPLVLLHTVRTQAEHFHRLIPLVSDRYTVYALDLPGMGYSDIVPGASYDEPTMRRAVTRLLTELDLHDVTLLGESMGAVLALTTAAELPDRARRVIAVNPYDYKGGIKRSGPLARFIIGGVTTPGVGRLLARLEPRDILQKILQGGLVNPAALSDEYLDELLTVGQRQGYATVARAVYRNLPSLIAARKQYTDVAAPVHLVHGEHDWSRKSDRAAYQQLLPSADFTQVPNAGHFISLEHPDLLADVLNELA